MQVRNEDIMANRNWANGGKIFAMHVSPVLIDATVQIGAAGAVSSFVGSTVEDVTREAQGVYKIKLQSQTNFPKLYMAVGTMQSPAVGLSGIMAIEVQNAPNADVAISSGAELTVKLLDVTGALADPASGSALNVMMLFSNSSVQMQGE